MRISIIVLCILLSFSIFASEYTPKGPLNLRNQNPIYLQFLNLEPTRAVALKKGEYSFRIDNSYSNVFERGINSSNNLLLDMEILRTALKFDAGIYDGMSAGIEIPFLRLDTGFLDKFLQDYHNAFGFPNAGREAQPNGTFTYRLSRNGNVVYQVVDQEDLNIGDITLNFKHNFWEEKDIRPAVAWLFYLKLPTGDRGEGLGSGSPDFGFGTALEKSYNRWHGYLNLAYFVNGGHEPLQDYIYDIYFSYVAGIELSVSKPVSIVSQINGGSPLLKGTGLSQWDWAPLDLQVGIKGEHNLNAPLLNRFFWQLGFSEDLNANGPSVDITILGSIGIKFGKS